jgi:NADPH-dependent curcumin reductase CurA
MPGMSALLPIKNIWLTNEEIKSKKHNVYVSGAAGAVGSAVG